MLAKLEDTRKDISVVEGRDPDSELVDRWAVWTHKGIGKAKSELLSQFSRKGNKLNLEAPALNPEVKSCLAASALVRDQHLLAAQNSVGSAMVALGIVLSTEMVKESPDEVAFSNVMDAGQILADLFYQQTQSRRALIFPKVTGSSYRNLLKDTKPEGGFLFGQDLAEKLKATKNIVQAGQTLFGQSKGQNEKRPGNESENSRGQRGSFRGRFQHRPQYNQGQGKSGHQQRSWNLNKPKNPPHPQANNNNTNKK